MDLICPNCRGSLQRTEPGWADCALHGGRYEVLFDRATFVPVQPQPAMPLAAAEAVAPPVLTTCMQHPSRAATAVCRTCGTQLCPTCTFDVRGGVYCGDCGIAQAKSPAPAPPPVPSGNFGASGGMLNLSAAQAGSFSQASRVIHKCHDHPEVDSVASCRVCSKYVCATCDFALPGDVHLCPACVESQSTEDVSPKRKRLTHIAIACAAWSTLLFILMFVGAFNTLFQDPETGKVADLFITNITLWPLLAGFGMSVSALDSKLKNTGLMKAAAWWNGILGAIFLLIVIAANLGLIG